jgi:hypothetical protein
MFHDEQFQHSSNTKFITQTARWSHNSIYFFQNKESRLESSPEVCSCHSHLQNYSLETGVCSASGCVDAVNCNEVLWGLLVGTIPVLMWYCMSFSKAAILASSLAGFHTVGRSPVFTYGVGVSLPVSQRRCSISSWQYYWEVCNHECWSVWL